MSAVRYPKSRRLLFVSLAASALIALVSASAASHTNAPISSAAVDVDESSIQSFAGLAETAVSPVSTKGELAERPFYSNVLGRDLPFLIYLPPGLQEGKRY